MRLVIGCLLLLVTPTMALVVIKQYQAQQAEEQRVPQMPVSTRGEVLFFNASWCGPCRRMKPIVTEMRRQGFRLRDIDVDKNRAMAEKYGIRGIPTFVFLVNGKEVHRFSGGTSADNLRKMCSTGAYR